MFCATLACAADLSGTWKFTVETEQGSGTPTFVLKQDGENLSGTYSGMLGEAKVTGTVKGAQVVIRFDAEMGGEKLKIEYSGEVESASRMKGKVQFGDYGSGTWTAARQ